MFERKLFSQCRLVVSGQILEREEDFRYHGSKLSRNSSMESKAGGESKAQEENCWRFESNDQELNYKNGGKRRPCKMVSTLIQTLSYVVPRFESTGNRLSEECI